MFRSRTFSFGVAAAMLVTSVVSLTPRRAAADGPTVVRKFEKILCFRLPGHKEVLHFGKYTFTTYDNGDFDDGGADKATEILEKEYNIPADNIWFKFEYEDDDDN